MHVSCCLATLWCRRDYYIFFIDNLSGLSSFVQGNTFVLPAMEHAYKVALVRGCCIAHQLGPSRACASVAFSVGHMCKMCVSFIDLIWRHLAGLSPYQRDTGFVWDLVSAAQQVTIAQVSGCSRPPHDELLMPEMFLVKLPQMTFQIWWQFLKSFSDILTDGGYRCLLEIETKDQESL